MMYRTELVEEITVKNVLVLKEGLKGSLL